MITKPRNHFVAILAAFVILLLQGCGGDGIATYPVTGKVVFPDGTPVKFGSVEFHHPEHDLSPRGAIQQDGTFEIGTFDKSDGAPAGLHQVVVTQLIFAGETGITPHEHGQHIDDRYSDYGSSKLEFDVSSTEKNDFEIVVEPQARKKR